MLLDGQAGIVTGAAGGIGRGIACVLAAEGAAVVVTDLERAREGGETTVAMITELGGRAVFVAHDVSDPAQAQSSVTTCVDNFGRFDFAVNNAGIAVVKAFADFTDQDYDLVTDVNLRGTFVGMRTQIRQLLTTGGGAIVNVASVAGLTAVRDIGIYTATKHGIIGMTKNAAMEYGGAGVRINAVCPNAIRTPLLEGAPQEFRDGLLAPQAIKRLGEPEEVGHAVAWLLSERAAYVTGVALPVDGGYLTGA